MTFPEPKFILPPHLAERAVEERWLRADDVIVSHPVPAGNALAAAIGRVLAEWRRTGYLPPEVCGAPYPLMPEFRCTHEPHGPDVLHGYNGPFPPEENQR